jgi:predicted dehydrogenase
VEEMKKILLFVFTIATVVNLTMAQTNLDSARFKLITLDPGHFHAALVQKFMYPDVDPLVHVYAAAGDDLQEHLKRIESFNNRADQPTHWREKVYSGPDFLEKMLAERPGNIVVIAGNNLRKTDYILKSVQAGLNVLADKPMAITPDDLEKLRQAFAIAAENHVLLYDIMTERFEVTTELQRALSQRPELFGVLEKGSLKDPAIAMKSVHYFLKTVAGMPLKRPAWSFDTRQQGEAMTDVATHLVDLVQWETFPEQILTPADANVLNARRWTTPVTLDQFKQVTGAEQFPEFLSHDVRAGVLQIYANGEFNYTLRGVFVKVTACWDFEAPQGSGDTHFSILRGTGATLVIRQGAEQKFKPVLYVEKNGASADAAFEDTLRNVIHGLQQQYPGIGFQREGSAWRITIPEKYDVGHEAHFSQVTGNFLDYLRAGKLPDWEAPNMLVKYETIMQAYRLSR